MCASRTKQLESSACSFLFGALLPICTIESAFTFTSQVEIHWLTNVFGGVVPGPIPILILNFDYVENEFCNEITHLYESKFEIIAQHSMIEVKLLLRSVIYFCNSK